MSRQKRKKNRSLHGVNEHFESLFNTASAALAINQSFLKKAKHIKNQKPSSTQAIGLANSQRVGCIPCTGLIHVPGELDHVKSLGTDW
jgi:hypothetical protein